MQLFSPVPSRCAGSASLTPGAQHPSHPDRPCRPSTKTPVQLAMPAQQAALPAGASMTVMGWGLLSSGERGRGSAGLLCAGPAPSARLLTIAAS